MAAPWTQAAQKQLQSELTRLMAHTDVRAVLVAGCLVAEGLQ